MLGQGVSDPEVSITVKSFYFYRVQRRNVGQVRSQP